VLCRRGPLKRNSPFVCNQIQRKPTERVPGSRRRHYRAVSNASVRDLFLSISLSLSLSPSPLSLSFVILLLMYYFRWWQIIRIRPSRRAYHERKRQLLGSVLKQSATQETKMIAFCGVNPPPLRSRRSGSSWPSTRHRRLPATLYCVSRLSGARRRALLRWYNPHAFFPATWRTFTWFSRSERRAWQKRRRRQRQSGQPFANTHGPEVSGRNRSESLLILRNREEYLDIFSLDILCREIDRSEYSTARATIFR